MSKHIYVIEHLEPKLWEWCLIEYKNISRIVGRENLWFTNIKSDKDKRVLEKYGGVFSEKVNEINIGNACVLDPEAPVTLNPKDAEKFRYFIFGGILGDYPPKKRTRKELTKFLPKAEKRNIGRKQFSTDNAVKVVYEILKGRQFAELPLQYKISVPINKIESVDMPYIYYMENGKPFMSPDIIKYLKKKKSF